MLGAEVGRRALEEADMELGVGLDPNGIEQLSDMPPFDTTLAYELYRQIFAPAEPLLQNVRHLIVVPDGALQSLPLGVT